MKKKNIEISGNKITLRLIRNEDIEEYYQNGFNPIDKEVLLYTGTKHIPTKETIKLYVNIRSLKISHDMIF